MKTIIGFEHYGPEGSKFFTREGGEPVFDEEIIFGDDFANLKLTDVLCEVSHGAEATTRGRISLTPPFHYLGEGREKLVIRAEVSGPEGLIPGVQRPTKMAVGVAISDYTDEGRLGSGPYTYRLASRMGYPTYPFYGQAVDRSLCFLPDLSQKGRFIFSSNTWTFTPEAGRWAGLHFASIREQLEAFAARASQGPDYVFVTHDTYFFLLSEKGCQVFFGDFDGMALQESSSFPEFPQQLDAVRGHMNARNLQQAQYILDRFRNRANLDVPYCLLAPVYPYKAFEPTPPPPKGPHLPEGIVTNTRDARLWLALTNCEAGTRDPREYYANFFADEGLRLEEALAKMDQRVRDLFDINVRGFLGEEV